MCSLRSDRFRSLALQRGSLSWPAVSFFVRLCSGELRGDWAGIYYGLTSMRGLQTLGEEYCDVVMAHNGTPHVSVWRRMALFVVGLVVPFMFRKHAASPLVPVLKSLHLGLFYMEGVYLHWAKRLTSLRYVPKRKLVPEDTEHIS